MALPIRDGNQSLTTLSTILVSSSHIPAHTVISFGTQGITDIATAVSGVELGPNTLNALENITVTLGQVTITGGLTDAQLRASAVTIGGGIYLSDAQVVIGGSAPPEAIQIGGYNLADNKLYPIHVDDLGVQTIKGAVTASISGTASVTFGTAVITGSTSILNFPATQPISISSVTIGSLPDISGTVTAGNLPIYNETDTIVDGSVVGSVVFDVNGRNAFGASGVTVGSIPSLPAGTNRIGSVTAQTDLDTSTLEPCVVPAFGTPAGVSRVTFVNPFPVQIQNTTGQISSGNPLPIFGTVTIGAGTVTIGAGTAQIGSVTASGTVTIGNNITLLGNQSSGLAASVLDGAGIPVYFRTSDQDPAGGNFPISGTVTIANIQGTAVTTSNFTSTTPSTVLAGFNATREVLTIFNEGAGNLHISAGTTCTTLAYQVRLSAGDYYEAPLNQSSITHSAVFATAGTARVTQVS
jgi:hypothetical protein